MFFSLSIYLFVWIFTNFCLNSSSRKTESKPLNIPQLDSEIDELTAIYDDSKSQEPQAKFNAGLYNNADTFIEEFTRFT